MSSQCSRVARALLAGTALVGLAGLAGCSAFHWHRTARSQTPVSAPVAAAASDALPPEPQTVTDALDTPAEQNATPTDADAGSTTVVADVGPELKSSAPKSYVIRHGDTLWGIANMYLRDPWAWPEIWYVNPKIQNPHRIYPGDELRLALGSNGHTTLQLVRAVRLASAAPDATQTRLHPLLRSSALDVPIETIPYSIIGAFLSHPTVLTADQIRAAPYVVALAENHDIAGTGHEIYIKQLAGETGSRYNVFHVDEPLINPDNGHRLGYLAIYTGTAELTQPGRIAKGVLTDSSRETLQGDILMPEDHGSVADFVPHVPERAVTARIMAVVDNVLLAGQNEVVAINRGSNDGLERGHVLTVDQAVTTARDPCANIDNSSTCVVHPTVTLPVDTAGTLLVFQTFANMSYALILNDTVPMQVGDRVHTP